jgi:hypothetical protein
MLQDTLTLEQMTLTPLESMPPGRTEAIAGIKLGIDQDHLTFSTPVEVVIPVDSSYNGEEIPVRVQHAGETTFGTEGITTDPNATCS